MKSLVLLDNCNCLIWALAKPSCGAVKVAKCLLCLGLTNCEEGRRIHTGLLFDLNVSVFLRTTKKCKYAF